MDKFWTTSMTAVAPVVWGTTYIVTTEMLPAGHPLFASLVRALPAGLLAIALTRVLPTGAWCWKSGVLGLLNIGVFFPLLFVAAYHLPGGVAATLGAAQPLVVALLVVAIVGERFSAWRLFWGVVGIIGVALVVLRSTATLDAVGVIAGLLSAVSMGFGVTLTKKWGRAPGVPAMGLVGWQLTAGGLFLLPITLMFEGIPAAIDVTAFAGYTWLGVIGGLLTYTVWFSGIGRLPVASVAVLGLLSPLVAATLGALLLGQSLGVVQVVGFALALTAVAAGQVTPRRRPLPGHGLCHETRRSHCSCSAARLPGDEDELPTRPVGCPSDGDVGETRLLQAPLELSLRPESQSRAGHELGTVREGVGLLERHEGKLDRGHVAAK